MNKALNIAYSKLISFCIAIGLFTFFIHHPFPSRGIAYGAIVFLAMLVSWDKNLLKTIFGHAGSNLKLTSWIIFTLTVSLITAAMLRNEANLPLVPYSLTWFAPIAVLIGSMEELLFRGWLLSQFSGKQNLTGILFASLAHASYKSLLFISPYLIYSVDPWHLFAYTFLAGLFLGLSRVISGSVWPALLAHTVFDIIIYGDQLTPWWVF
ncbi:MAG TPA: CPBP family intramembrane glutamic endopeptidase [Chitinophagaceae bacterium]|nr:CPBP family intramembrane glutamic endopeptidase [Chitinophagaceae bacterium]